jgi:hypothetical protein
VARAFVRRTADDMADLGGADPRGYGRSATGSLCGVRLDASGPRAIWTERTPGCVSSRRTCRTPGVRRLRRRSSFRTTQSSNAFPEAPWRPGRTITCCGERRNRRSDMPKAHWSCSPGPTTSGGVRRPSFLALPGGARGNLDSAWEAISASVRQQQHAGNYYYRTFGMVIAAEIRTAQGRLRDAHSQLQSVIEGGPVQRVARW